ncbi:hybrid sensor histidine kinase/response regulator [Noviherbaspirillum sp. Root189]|uniref:hybrid sensor histidine kinase/response regulator n=1 Tax=Noviherbaspirillum sp. Root189 TaxID=1736487 RepID=UPI0007097B85|nr:PAS domain-containing sensor histidine kinase [Noviherbaspirillum sp. Root189]KRB85120.1 PAS domain-containing sensor histidine kinase [Noviherbaspirillum sp. Root189]
MQDIPKTSIYDLSDATRFQLFVQSVNDYAIYMLTPEGYVNSWNAGAQRFKGYESAEIIGKHFSLFYTEEDKAIDKPGFALRTASTEGKFEDEGWHVRKDGSRFWASVVIDPIHDENGHLIGFAKITRDITEQKAAHEALLESERRFRYLVQGVTDYAIYMLSPEGEVTNWNAGAQHIKGYAANEVIGTHFSRFYTEEDRDSGMPANALETAAKVGRYESEGWRVRKDGTRFWANVVIDAIRNDQGELIGFAKVTRDITERRNATLALERAQEALFQSQKLEAIGKLTGGVAHDFNNLLGVLSNGLEILSMEVQSQTGVKMLDAMQRAVTRGSTLTQQLLSFARQQPLRQDKYNLNRVIEKFEAVLRRAVNETINFDVQLRPNLSPVMIDAVQFETALLNLVTNARDAMPDGGVLSIVTEDVTLRERETGNLPAGRYVKVVVRDNGVGMTPDVVSRSIDPFFTTKPVGKGTGMGLSQVYGLVKQSGGYLDIASEAGKGSAISIYLPALDQEANESTASTETNAGNDKALVVDDQPDVLEAAVELFKMLGYDVLSANNAADAIDILKRHHDIDVLFSDVVMPDMDGIMLAREARKLVPGIAVLLASGYPAPMVGDDSTDIGDFQFISKPYRMAEILKRLRVAS